MAGYIDNSVVRGRVSERIPDEKMNDRRKTLWVRG